MYAGKLNRNHYFYKMYKAIVNKKSFEIETTETGFRIDGKDIAWDMVKINDTTFHILYQNKSYAAELVKTDRESKTFVFKINGRTYPVTLKDKFDLLLEKMGMNSTAGSKVNAVKAPMPGLIVDLKIQVGDSVKPGDALLILEAMKMENILKSPGEGIVKTLKVKKGDSVEKGQVLVEF
ncbi:MAG: biotin/lipoyl attachment domain-containing protein [Bacteroidetes bacterium OLB12]|nr:MAG: biotin/lipoyl attachment domain-containing protein [Bacteroidetes bacterium OLB12]